MRRAGLSRQLLVPYVILLALLTGAMANLIWAAKQERDALERATESLKHQNNLLMEIGALRREAQRAILSYRFDGNDAHLVTLRRLEPQIDQLYAELRQGANNKREAELADMMLNTRTASAKIRAEMIRAIQEGREPEARLTFQRWTVHSRKLEALLSDLTALNVKALDQEVIRMDRARAKAIWTAAVMVLLTGLVLVVFAFLSRRQFIKPLIELTRTAKAITAGNLSRRVGGADQSDEIGVLAGAFNEMTASLAAAKAELEDRMAELAGPTRISSSSPTSPPTT